MIEIKNHVRVEGNVIKCKGSVLLLLFPAQCFQTLPFPQRNMAVSLTLAQGGRVAAFWYPLALDGRQWAPRPGPASCSLQRGTGTGPWTRGHAGDRGPGWEPGARLGTRSHIGSDISFQSFHSPQFLLIIRTSGARRTFWSSGVNEELQSADRKLKVAHDHFWMGRETRSCSAFD